jgi:uncharacterized Zn finger protein
VVRACEDCKIPISRIDESSKSRHARLVPCRATTREHLKCNTLAGEKHDSDVEYDAMSDPFVEAFDPVTVTKLAGQRTLGRGLVVRERDIENIVHSSRRMTATVRGTLPYVTSIWIDDSGHRGFSCTCPQGDDGKFCKHLVAVARTLHGGEDIESNARPKVEERNELAAFVDSLDHATLVRRSARRSKA